MHYHIPAIESPADGSRRILANLLENIGDTLATPAATSDSNIHDMRKTCKRLRALLRMLRPSISADGFRVLDGKIREFASQLAVLRDNKVMLDTLDQVGQHFAALLREETFAPVHEALVEVTNRGAGQPAAALDLPALRARITDILTLARELDCRQISEEKLLDGIVGSYRRGRRALARVEASPDTGHAHRLRRLAKYQYYQLQMLSAWNEAAIRPLERAFHKLEDTLGQEHDLAVLESMLTDRPQLCQGRVRRELLHALIESRRIAFMSQALQLARELYHAKPGKYRHRLPAATLP